MGGGGVLQGSSDNTSSEAIECGESTRSCSAYDQIQNSIESTMVHHVASLECHFDHAAAHMQVFLTPQSDARINKLVWLERRAFQFWLRVAGRRFSN